MAKIFSTVLRSLVLSAAALLLSSLLPGPSGAVPANPHGVELSQPDGSKVKIFLKGDEFYSWHEDSGGYTVVKATPTGDWVYAEPYMGVSLKAGKFKVGSQDPAALGLKKHLRDSVRILRANVLRKNRDSILASRRASGAPAAPGKKTPILTGTLNNLVILARFSDQTTTYSRAEFASLFNDVSYSSDSAVGSVQDYYDEVSYNSLTVQTTVTEWVVLPQPFAYYGANDGSGNDVKPKEMVADAINALNLTGFNFTTVDANADGEVDGLDIIHSGMGEEYGGNDSNFIWSHMWELDAPIVSWDGISMQTYHTEPEVRGWSSLPLTRGITRIGVVCHETGHFLGLPDLYDYGGDSHGAGDFCLMGEGSWNGDFGTSPAHMSAWCKKNLGWATASQILISRDYSLPRIEDNPAALFLLQAGAFPTNEYFLMENRQGFGFDAALPGTSRGVLIWHIDENVANNNDQTHYKVDLEEAGGTQDLELNTNSGDDLDYFRFGNGSGFGDTTTPNSKSFTGKNLSLSVQNFSASADPMTFSLSGGNPSSPAPIVYPRPWKPGSGGTHDAPGITFANVPDDSTVKIFTIAGEMVKELTVARSDLNAKIWDGTNTAGKPAASGVYFVTVKSPSVPVQILRLAIER